MLKNTNLFLNAFLKLCVVTKKINVSVMAAQVSLDTGYLSRIFNNQFQLRKERNLYKICRYLGLDVDLLLETHDDFERFCERFKTAFYYCQSDVHQMYLELLEYGKVFEGRSPYYIQVMLLRLMYETEVKKSYSYVLLNSLMRIVTSLPRSARLLVWTYCVLADIQFTDFERPGRKDAFHEAVQLVDSNSNIRGRLYYFGLSYFRKYDRPQYMKKCYRKAQDSFLETRNLIMLEKLNMKYSGLLRAYGYMQKALQNDLALLHEFDHHEYQFRNVEILYNNIAWTYMLLHEFPKAVDYYRLTIQTLQDNEIYFNLAYCLYRLDQKAEALECIRLGRLTNSYGEYVYLLLEWLEAMINRKYSKKSYGILHKILKVYGTHLDVIVKDMLQIEIVNYLYYNGDYFSALEACIPLLSRTVYTPNELMIHETEDDLEKKISGRKRGSSKN